MLFSSLLDRFIKESPIAVMAQATISYALNAASLDAVFKEHASAQYELKITFSALVDLMSLVVCQVYRSVNSAYAKREEKIAASLVAVYGKLNRMELPITRAFVSEAAGRLLSTRLSWRASARLYRCRVLSCNGKPRGGHVCPALSSSTARKIHYIVRAPSTAPCDGATSRSTRP